MRTTIEVPDPMFREMKVLAARQGRSLKEFVVRAIKRQVEAARGEAKRYEVQLPLVRSKRPGALRSMTNAEIEDLLG